MKTKNNSQDVDEVGSSQGSNPKHPDTLKSDDEILSKSGYWKK